MTRIPYAWSDDENAYEECRLAAAADGGRFYFGKDGKALFRRMTAPIERGHSRTVQATLDQGNTRELTDSIAWRDVYSSVIVEWAGRYQAPITDLWTAPRAIEIPPGKTVTEEARYRYPAATVYAPVYGYDYHAMTMAPAAVPYGTGGLTVQTTAYGQRARIAMTNHGTVNTIYVSDLRLRGLPLVGDEAQEQRWEQTAGLVPGEKTYALRGNPLIQTADQAGRVGPYLRDRLQRPQRLLTWSGPGIPWVELLDRVRVSHRTMTPNPGVDLEAYVVGIEMDTSGGAWAQTLTLLPATGCLPTVTISAWACRTMPIAARTDWGTEHDTVVAHPPDHPAWRGAERLGAERASSRGAVSVRPRARGPHAARRQRRLGAEPV